ncbi:DUF2378 family protein [Hyalangium versicolor]|uniref:DUF2378 family protein n=1 Tax=Hyalangium versicolor TaxID=2861190 RepID=UPI001CD00A6E|nr:DUF2378 family protein [Hyalangium versicolor]
MTAMMTYEFNAEQTMPVLARLGLQERLLRTAPTDTVRGLFFNGVLEMVRTAADEEAVRRCRLMLNQARFFDFFSYSTFDFLRLTFAAAQYLSIRQEGFDAALTQLGERGMKDFLNSMAGKTFLSFSGMDARRMVTNLPVLFRTAVSYGERSVKWLGPQRCQLTMHGDFMPPAYHEGAIRAAVEHLHPHSVTVQSMPLDLLDSQYLISWR